MTKGFVEQDPLNLVCLIWQKKYLNNYYIMGNEEKFKFKSLCCWWLFSLLPEKNNKDKQKFSLKTMCITKFWLCYKNLQQPLDQYG